MPNGGAQLRTLAAVFDRLIPSDAHGPGAVEAGVVDYVLARYAGSGRADAELYAAGLGTLDARAMRRSGVVFAAASGADQDALLAEVEAEGLTLSAAARDGAFFETLLRHAREGMFGDPAHGGNRGFAGWDLLGYPDARRVWSAEEQGVDIVAPPREPRGAERPRVPLPLSIRPPAAGAADAQDRR